MVGSRRSISAAVIAKQSVFARDQRRCAAHCSVLYIASALPTASSGAAQACLLAATSLYISPSLHAVTVSRSDLSIAPAPAPARQCSLHSLALVHSQALVRLCTGVLRWMLRVPLMATLTAAASLSPKPRVLGVTGGIAMGKSTITKLLQTV